MATIFDEIDKRTANVYGIWGHLGGGKTLTAVDIMLHALQVGWSVTSNVKLVHLLPSSSGRYTYVEDFANQDFWALPQGAPRGSADPYRSCIVIDECAEFFDQYSSTSPQVKSFLSWLRHSSKRGQFVFLIVQQPEFIAKALRLLVNKWIVCFDLEQVRLPIIRIRLPFCGGFVARKVFDRWGNNISRGLCMANKIDIGYYYSTSQCLSSEHASEGEFVKDAALPYRNSMAFFAVLFAIYIFWWL